MYDPDAAAVLSPVRPTEIVGTRANNPAFVENTDDGWPDEFPDRPRYVKTPNRVVERRGGRSAYTDPIPKVVHGLSKHRTLEPASPAVDRWL